MSVQDSAAQPAAAPSAAAPAAPARRRKLPRWLRWTLLVLALAIVLRLLLAFTLSWLIEVGIGAAGLEGRVGGSSLSLHSGWLRLEHVEIRMPGGFEAKEGAFRENRAPPPDSSIAFDRLEADLDMGALLTGHVRVESLSLDELRVVMLRDQQGWLLLEALAGKPAGAPHEAEPKPAPEPSTEPPDLRLPVEIVRADIHPFHVRLLDGHNSNSDAPELDGSLRATDVGTEGKTGEWHLLINGPGAVDVVRVDGTLAAEKGALDATLTAELDGLRPDWLARYAAPASLRGTAQRVDGHVALTARLADEGRGVAVKAHVSAKLSADGHEALALDRCELELRPAPDGASSGLTVSISGLRGEAGKRVDGSLAIAGLDIVPAPASAATASKPEAAPEVAAAPPAAEAPAPPPALHVDDVELTDAHFAWRDESLGPGAALVVELPRVKLGPRDPAGPPTAPMPLALQLRVPGVCEAFTLDGQVVLATEAPAVDLKLHATGLALKALDPWLEPAGWQSELSDQGELGARLAAQAQVAPGGRVTATLQLHDVKLSDGEARLSLAGLVCERASFDPASGAVHVVRVDIDGPSVPAHRDAQGVLHVAGLRSVPPRRPALAEVPEIQGPPPPPLVIEDLAAPSAPSEPAAKPAPLVIGEVLWHGADFSLRDDAVAPPVDFALRPALKVQDLTLGDGAPKGTLVASLDAPAVWERCELGVSLHQAAAPATLGITAKLALGNLNAAGLEGWVRAAGLQLPGLHTDLDGTIDITTGGDRTDVKLDGLTWKDGGATVLSVPSVRVLGIGPAHGGTRIESVEVPDFEFTASRAADGALLLGGARFAPLAAGKGAPAPDPAPSAAPEPEPEPEARSATESASPAVFVLGALRFGTGKAVVHWHDAAVTPPVDAHLQIGASVDGLLMGARGDPARVALTLVAPQIMDGLKWEGTVQLAPDDMRVEGALAVEGVRLGPLAAYLPPGCSSTLKSGRLALKLAADAGAAAAGGQRAALHVTDLSWRDADEAPMLALDALTVSATRLDPAAGVAVVDQVALTGLQIQAARRPGGALSLLGFEFGPPPLGPEPPPLVPTPPAPAPASTKPAGPATATAATNAAPSPVAPRPSSSATPQYRDLRVNSVDFELRGLTLTDQSGAGGAPLVLAARLKSPEPLILADSSREDLQSARLELRASAEPVMRSLAMDVSVDVAAARPNLRVDLSAEGLRGAGLTEILPELAEKLDGSGLTDGSFSAKFLADLSWPRRGPLDFDFGGGLSGELDLTDVALRTQPDADPVLALKRLEVDMADVRPAVGLLHFSSIEMDYPYARAAITPEGLHFAGLLLKAPPPPEGAAPEAATAEAAPPPEPPPTPPPVAAPPPPPSGAPATRLKIDRILASGLDVELRDDTSTPPMVLPIADLDVDVHDLSSGISPARPVRFTVSLRGGNVSFPKRVRSDASLTGLVGSTARAIGGGSEKQDEQRRIFDELLVQGRLVPGIPPVGWCNINLSSLELQAFAGPALRAGLIINDGTLDATVRIRMNGPEGSDVDSTLTFTYLALAEPENGPISRWLRLSAPLDSVLFLLRNADGEHIIPADFHVQPGGLGRGEVQGAATSAIGSVIARALASAPLRLIGSVTDLVGVTGREGPPPEPPIVLDYAPGDPVLPAGADRMVWELTRKLLDDEDLDLVLQHEFGTGDARVATTLGNPSPEDARRLQERLAARRLERERLRDSKAAESRALLAVGRPVEAREAAQEVIGFDRDIAATEDAQDRLLTLLDPGAGRRISGRTRAAGMEFGQARLDDIRRRIGAMGGEEILKRVELRPVRFEPNAERDGGQVTLTLKPHPRSGGVFHWLFGWIPELFRSDPEPPPP